MLSFGATNSGSGSTRDHVTIGATLADTLAAAVAVMKGAVHFAFLSDIEVYGADSLWITAPYSDDDIAVSTDVATVASPMQRQTINVRAAL